MVGKARRPRLHRAAPRPQPQPQPRPAWDPPQPPEPGPGPGPGPAKDWDFSSSGVFAGLKIDPDTLVKKLDLDSRSIISSRTGLQTKPVITQRTRSYLSSDELPGHIWSQSEEVERLCEGTFTSFLPSNVGEEYCFRNSELTVGLEEKTVLSKKEKMKLRKERWLQKIESVKMMKQKQKAEAKRKATPVVGDMQPLMEALPELSELTTGGRGRKPLKSHTAKAEPSDFCLMKQAQKHRLLEEEVARFHEVITDPKYRANPLMAISKHLSKRLRLGEEGNPL